MEIVGTIILRHDTMKFINLLTESFVNKNYTNRFVDKETIISKRLGILETSQLSRFLG